MEFVAKQWRTYMPPATHINTYLTQNIMKRERKKLNNKAINAK